VADQVPNSPGRTASVAARAYCAVALGNGRVRLAWDRVDAPGKGGAAGFGGFLGPTPQSAVRQAAGAVEPVQREAAGFGDAYSARLARLIHSAAVSEAARVRRQVSGQSAAICEAAEREVAAIRRQASAQSAAIREAAQREAAELRLAVMEMSAELGGVVDVRLDLISPAKPVTGPEGQLTAQPATRPATNPRARPGTARKGRQARAMRKVLVALVALSLIGVISGAVEIKLHGVSFFLFRNAGAGAGNSHDLNENQGPGQPDAPGAHHMANPG
jgi:hypothetical protein